MSTQRNDTENTVDKSRSILIINLSNKSNIIEKPSEIYIQKDNLSASGFYEQGESLSSATRDILCIPCNNKRKKTPDNSIIIKNLFKNQSTQRKRQKKII